MTFFIFFIRKIANHFASFTPPTPNTQAVSAVAAEDGVRFMQEMMELSSQQQKEQLPPRAIQIVSHPFYGRVVLTAGPAQFGTDLSKSSTGVSIQKEEVQCQKRCKVIKPPSLSSAVQVRGFVTVAEPYSGCAEITNGEYVRGHIALLQRGQCMFAEKARHILKAGAIGGIVIGERAHSVQSDCSSVNTRQPNSQSASGSFDHWPVFFPFF